MGTVPMGIGLLRIIHSQVAWIFFPVESPITVSAPHCVDQRIFSSLFLNTGGHCTVANIRVDFYKKFRPMIIGSGSDD